MIAAGLLLGGQTPAAEAFPDTVARLQSLMGVKAAPPLPAKNSGPSVFIFSAFYAAAGSGNGRDRCSLPFRAARLSTDRALRENPMPVPTEA